LGVAPNTLVFGRPRVGLDDDAVMRIGDEAPGGRPILWDGVAAATALVRRSGQPAIPRRPLIAQPTRDGLGGEHVGGLVASGNPAG
jgi:hypothetical protein